MSNQGLTRKPGAELAIRWFTPRGRRVRRELLEDLRHADGAHVRQILDDVRRAGLPPDVLDLRGIDLRGEDLAGSSLVGADLTGARLDQANLARTDLTRARLVRANMSHADLRGATLRGANLLMADLRGANLSEADLQGASLRGGNLAGATLRHTWIRGADLHETQLEGVDLSTVRRRTYRPPPSTTRLRQCLGAPPASEPRPKTRRAGTTRLRPPAATLSLDEALARILMERGDVDRIVATINGVTTVLFARQAQQEAA